MADISQEEDVDRLLQTVIQHYGQLNVLVNNAGQGGWTESLQDFDQFINTNLRSVYQLSHLALPHLEKTRGVIVNNSSICGLKPVCRINECHLICVTNFARNFSFRIQYHTVFQKRGWT